MGRLYSNLKIFHHQKKLDSLPEWVDAILPPIHIRIKPTNLCNHNCRYCAYRSDHLQLGKNMNTRDFIPREKMLEIVRDIVEMEVKAVTFSGGGDPFCYPYLAEAAASLAKHTIAFASLTNGARLTGEAADIFANEAAWVRISMDGWDDKSYAAYRGVNKGEFKKVIGNIESFKIKGGKCYLGVSIIVDEKNASHQFDLIKTLFESGVDSVKISPCILYNDGEKNNRYHEPFFNIVKEQLVNAKETFKRDSFEIYDAYHLLDEKFDKGYTWCPYLQILPVIGADLSIYSCQDKAYNLEEGFIGSIKEIGFKQFWMNDKSKFFRINPQKICRHHCVANQKNRLVMEYLSVDMDHGMFV